MKQYLVTTFSIVKEWPTLRQTMLFLQPNKSHTLNLIHGDVIIMVMSLSRNGGTGLGKSYCGNDTDVIFLYLIFVSV